MARAEERRDGVPRPMSGLGDTVGFVEFADGLVRDMLIDADEETRAAFMEALRNALVSLSDLTTEGALEFYLRPRGLKGSPVQDRAWAGETNVACHPRLNRPAALRHRACRRAPRARRARQPRSQQRVHNTTPRAGASQPPWPRRLRCERLVAGGRHAPPERRYCWMRVSTLPAGSWT
jgi:hypothetical protein